MEKWEVTIVAGTATEIKTILADGYEFDHNNEWGMYVSFYVNGSDLDPGREWVGTFSGVVGVERLEDA